MYHEEGINEEEDDGDVEPYLVTQADIVKWRVKPSFPFPSTHEERVAGWKLVNRYFVDSSGWGRAGEPALTTEQFVSKLKPGCGYAIIGEGQFQVWVGEYKEK